MKDFPEFKSSNQIKNIFPEEVIQKFWLDCFEDVYFRQKDTWDYQWVYANFINRGLSVMPHKNLVSNIGFGDNATHTLDGDDKNANRILEKMGKISHPSFFVHGNILDKKIYTSHIGLSLRQSVDLPFKQLGANDSQYLFKKFHSKLHFVIFSPKKFTKKYYYKFLNSSLRQPTRRIWYKIRFKKLK